MNRLSGQGLMEYLLVLAVVLLAVVGFAMVFRSGVNTAQDTMNNGITQATQNASN